MSEQGFWNEDLGFAKTEKEAIIFFQDKGLLPITKQCVNGHKMALYSYEREHLRERIDGYIFAHQGGGVHYNAYLT